MDPVVAWLVWLWGLTEVKFLVGHVVVNLVVAVAVALHTGEFQLKKLGEFLTRKLLPYVLVYGVVRTVGEEAGLGPVAGAVWVIIEATLAGDLAENLGRLGVPVPEWVGGGADRDG